MPLFAKDIVIFPENPVAKRVAGVEIGRNLIRSGCREAMFERSVTPQDRTIFPGNRAVVPLFAKDIVIFPENRVAKRVAGVEMGRNPIATSQVNNSVWPAFGPRREPGPRVRGRSVDSGPPSSAR